MSEWEPRETAPKDGTEIHVQAAWGKEPVDGKISYDGMATYKEFTRPGFDDPLTGKEEFQEERGLRWVRSDSGKVVPGRIVRWKHKSA